MLPQLFLLSFLIFNDVSLSQQQQQRLKTTNTNNHQSQKNEPKVKGSADVTILVKNGLAKHQGLIETEAPLILWCQAVEIPNINKRTILAAEEIYFTHNGKTHAANFSEANNYNGTLVLSEVYYEYAGEWTCHIKTKEHGLLFGTIKVNVRPVVLTNTRLRIYEIPDQKFKFEATGRAIVRGGDINLTCPVFGVPKPDIIWIKGKEYIKTDERIKLDKNGTLLLQNVSYLDQDIYTCKAINTFVDKSTNINKVVQSEVIIERHLRIKSEFSWLLPLGIIIFLVTLLLVIIILCEMRKRRREQKQLLSVNSGNEDD